MYVMYVRVYQGCMSVMYAYGHPRVLGFGVSACVVEGCPCEDARVTEMASVLVCDSTECTTHTKLEPQALLLCIKGSK